MKNISYKILYAVLALKELFWGLRLRLAGRDRYICAHAFLDKRYNPTNVSPCCFLQTGESIEQYLESEGQNYTRQIQELRKKIMRGDYSSCPKHCHTRRTGEKSQRFGLFRPVVDYQAKMGNWRHHRKRLIPAIPAQRIVAAFEDSCNYACPMCRQEAHGNKLSENFCDQLWGEIGNGLASMTVLSLGGSGEPLIQEHVWQFLAKITRHNAPLLQEISIVSNGSHLNIEKMASLPIFNQVCWRIQISLDAATEQTYKKIRRQSNFTTIISQIKKATAYSNVLMSISFVIQRDNYQEFPLFIDLANSLGVSVIAAEVRGVDSSLQVHLPQHPEYQQFRHTLAMVKKMPGKIYLSGL